MTPHNQPANPAHWKTVRSVFTPLLVLVVLCVPPAWAQAATTHFLARTATTHYIFDTPLPADFAEMVTASGNTYRSFQQFPQVTNATVDGRSYRVVTIQVAWDGDKVDQGTLAFAQNGRVDVGWWFTMDAGSPQWPAVASQLKAQAVPNGNWRHATLLVLVTDESNQPPLRMPIPETVRIQASMDDFDKQTRPGVFFPSVQIPAGLDALRGQMLAYGNVARSDPDFRRKHGASTATDLSGNTVRTLGGTEKVFRQNPSPPWFADSRLDDDLNRAAQFQAEYNASINVMSHDGPSAYTDPNSGKRVNMRSLGDRAAFFGIQSIVEAAGGGSKAREYPHGWMVGDTHFRPWFNVDGVYPTFGYGVARAATGNWHFVAVATRYPDGAISGGATPPSAPPSTPPSSTPPSAGQQALLSLRSHNFPDRFIRHRDYKGFIDPVESELDRNDSTFMRVGGLADGASVSLEAVNFPGYFLVMEGEAVVLRQRPANDPQFDRNATFIQRPGLADGSKLSLESYAQRGAYLRHMGFVLYVHPVHDSDLFRVDATFGEAAPGCVAEACRR